MIILYINTDYENVCLKDKIQIKLFDVNVHLLVTKKSYNFLQYVCKKIIWSFILCKEKHSFVLHLRKNRMIYEIPMFLQVINYPIKPKQIA